jgi:hypothetical protein
MRVQASRRIAVVALVSMAVAPEIAFAQSKQIVAET